MNKLFGHGDLVLKLRMLGHGEDSFIIESNDDEQDISVVVKNKSPISDLCYENWIEQLKHITEGLEKRLQDIKDKQMKEEYKELTKNEAIKRVSNGIIPDIDWNNII